MNGRKATVKMLAVAAMLIGAFATPASAANKYWVVTDGDWGNGFNWDTAGAPSGVDNAWFTNNSTYTVTLTNDNAYQSTLITNTIGTVNTTAQGLTVDLNGYTLTQSGTTVLYGNNSLKYLNGTVTTNTGAANGYYYIGYTAAANLGGLTSTNLTGTLTIGTNAIVNVNSTTTGMYVGFNQGGVLNIKDGGILNNKSNGHTTIGDGTNLLGQVNITNGGTWNQIWTNNGKYLYVGYVNGATGEINIAGSGSKLVVPAEVDGTAVTNRFYLSVGAVTGAKGYLNVTDHGLLNAPTLEIFVGNAAGAYGEMIVSGGGVVTGKYLSVGRSANYGAGKATVDGAGSLVFLTNDLTVGSSGQGLLIVTNGGFVNGGNMQISYYGGGGTAIVTGAGSAINAKMLTIGGLGTNNPNAAVSRLEITHGASLTATGGTTVTTHKMFTNSIVHIDNGSLTLTGNLISTNCTYSFVLEGADPDAMISVSGSLSLSQTATNTLQLAIGDDFAYAYETKYRLFGFGTLNASNQSLIWEGNVLNDADIITVGGYSFEYSLDSTWDPGYITLTAIPEPASGAILMAGIVLVTALRRRQMR